ncbi:Beta-mannosyltransferase 2 [Candida viswanathii]|uniref:Beta-mannosyltransferase 2 n=1 Tax=Candida viswanathii TaxID=5486 RepID=A0A367XMG6_9ASCO|nr:Beta-mannosyltransferase 2 [Candida viswanathii]
MAYSMRILRKLRGKKLPLTIMFLLISTSLLFVELTKYSQQKLMSQMNVEVTDKPKGGDRNRHHIENNRNNNNNDRDEINKDRKIIIFPSWTPLNSVEIKSYYTDYLNLKLPANENYIITKHDPERDGVAQTTKVEEGEGAGIKDMDGFKKYRGEVFKLGNNKASCSALSQYISFETSLKKNLNSNLTDVIVNFMDSKSDYFLELLPFLTEVPEQLAKGTISEHWFQMVGNSVYLKEYGVHLMVSRIMYSPLGSKNEPLFSFAYAQIFNRNWEELKNVELIVPDNINESTKMISYPGILSIPIHHDYREVKDSYFGPEDPRVIVVRNSEGFEEPLIIYNAFHRKITDVEQTIEGYKNVRYDYFRSMFMSYLWLVQLGKRNIEETDDMEWRVYLKTKEIRVVDTPRESKEKNWTPMISYMERQLHKFDRFIYFVYKWSDLQVLKCSLDEGLCQVVYKLPPKPQKQKEGENIEVFDEEVGALRGGTPMINIRDLNIPGVNKKLLSDKEIWIGFPRAHLTMCDCSNHMYRPNLAIITKTGSHFRISHISSFMSFNVELIGWYPGQNKLCDPNVQSVFIPNGISEWVFDEGSDLMTLTFSLSDITIDMIQVRGLMTALMDEKLGIFSGGTGDDVGFNNVNINCALDSSRNYCNLMDQLDGGEMRQVKEFVDTS